MFGLHCRVVWGCLIRFWNVFLKANLVVAFVSTVHALIPKITINGEEHVRHFQGFPYVDAGAEAKVTMANGALVPVHVKTISNTVPPGCETLGQYEIEYEAFGPDPNGTPSSGKRATAQRIVEIGKYLLVISFIMHFLKVVLGLLTGYRNISLHGNLV